MVYEALSKLPNSHSCGPDGFPTILLKKCAVQLAQPLCTIFSLCFYTGNIPVVWKDAIVVPIFKGKGSASSPSNYRPISLTCTVCKVMESCIKKPLLSYFIKNDLISSKQHGFLPNKPTLTELVECLNDWTLALDRGEKVDVVYFDLAKAFDSVTHSKLIAKCKSYGVCGNFANFSGNFSFEPATVCSHK